MNFLAIIGGICLVAFLAVIFYHAHRDVTYGYKNGWKDEDTK